MTFVPGSERQSDQPGDGGRGRTAAEIYMSVAPIVIDKMLTCREHAVWWWLYEKDARRDYGLSPSQEQDLIDLLASKFPKQNPA